MKREIKRNEKETDRQRGGLGDGYYHLMFHLGYFSFFVVVVVFIAEKGWRLNTLKYKQQTPGAV